MEPGQRRHTHFFVVEHLRSVYSPPPMYSGLYLSCFCRPFFSIAETKSGVDPPSPSLLRVRPLKKPLLFVCLPLLRRIETFIINVFFLLFSVLKIN